MRGGARLAATWQPLGFGGGREPWLSVLPRYAELQQGEAVRARDHVDRGVPDRRIATFPSVYDATLARPLPLSERDFELLQRFRPRFGELCEELAAGGLPETIQHDDLHGGNVYLQEGTARILDWGDSCISHPFLTLFVTFAHSEEADGGPNHGAWFAPLRDAYLEIWGEAVDLRASAEIALRLGAFAHLFKEFRVFDAVPQEKRSKCRP
jgi:hypothetical protein